ncbi:MAG: dockerin type I repeat-containing protein, partial [Acutalibacteraceae bacterium]|nr:dockerin type I repeat-containing protein [Acutalibacteraceae bacterium]
IQADGSMGIVWYHSFENHLEKSGDNILIYESPTVYGVYEQQENGKYSCTSIGLDGYCLTKTEDGYILDRNLNGTEHYDNTGRLMKIYDKYGYGISLTHGENYIRVTDDLTDKGFNIELENGRITAMTDDYGRNVSFNYTGDMLTKILDTEGNSKTYEYDIYGKILTSSDTVNSYDSEGRIVSAVFENESYSFSYNGSTVTVNNAVYTFGEEGQLTDFTEQNGNTYSYIYDEKGNIITESSKEGSISYTYHSFSRPEKAVYSNGSAVSFIYDENGNLLEKIYPLNGDANRDGTADIMDIVRMKKYIAEIENTEIDIFNSDYNSDGINSMDLTYLRRLLLFSDRASLRAKEEYVYNERNQLILYCDKSGTETTYSYDSNGFSTE